jgi:hypothetical protein
MNHSPIRKDRLRSLFSVGLLTIALLVVTVAPHVLARPVAGYLTESPAAITGDEYEPDNWPAQAKDLPPQTVQTRSLIPPEGLMGPDVDWVKIEVPPGIWPAYFQTIEKQAGIISVDLCDSNWDSPLHHCFVGSSEDGKNKLTFSCSDVPISGGVYYLQIRSVANVEIPSYSLSWNITGPGCEPPDLRPHEVPGSESVVVPNMLKNATEASSQLYAGPVTYFDFALINDGPGQAPLRVHYQLWVDDIRIDEGFRIATAPGQVSIVHDVDFTVRTPGWHTVRLVIDPDDRVVETNEENNVWEMDFYWLPVIGWWAEIYDNPALEGEPALVRNDPEINFDWQEGSPAPGINPERFSIRWWGLFNFEGGPYRFNLDASEKLTFDIDYESMVEQFCNDECFGKMEVVQDLSSGTHRLRFEIMETGGPAHAKLDWDRCHSMFAMANPGGSGEVTISPEPNCDQYYLEGSRITLTAIPDAGYTFSHWSDAATGTSKVTSITIDKTGYATANFDSDDTCYSLKIDRVGQGSIPVTYPRHSKGCLDNTYLINEEISLWATPAPGWRVKHWRGTIHDDSQWRYNSLIMDGAKEVVVVYEPIPGEISFSSFVPLVVYQAPAP